MPLKRLLLEKLDGGISQASPELLGDDQCQACENTDYSAILGAFVTRKGSAALNTVALNSATAQVLSNFKLYKSDGNNYRYTQAGTIQFRNFVSFKTGLASSRVAAVGYRNQSYFSDGTTLWADDGTSSSGYPWGIAAPAGTLSVSFGVNTLAFARFDNSGTNSEAWASVRGTQSFDTTIKKEGVAAISIVGDATVFEGISTLTLATASDLSSNGGQPVNNQGYFQIWMWVSDPLQLQSLTLAIDVNAGDFAQDYYVLSQNVRPARDYEEMTFEQIGALPSVSYNDARDILSRRRSAINIATSYLPLTSNSWTLISVPMAWFERVGAAFGKDYRTVKALLVGFQANSVITVKFDAWNLLGNHRGVGTEDYYYYETFQWRDSAGNLQSESNPGPISAAFRSPGGIGVITTTNTTTNSMVTHRGFYRVGGNLDQPYLAGTATYAATATYTDTLSDVQALFTNIVLATDNNVSPGSYYPLEGPHYDRIFAGSATTLRWTKANQPHAWPATNTAPLPGAQSGDTIRRIVRFSNRIFIFNYTQVYELAGDSEDNFELRQTYSRTGTPARWSVVNAGDRMIYVGGQGTRADGIYFHDGVIDRKVSFERLEPFFSGRTVPGGIAPLNTSSASLCHAAWYKSNYWLAYPSGTNTACDRILRIDFSHEQVGVPITVFNYTAPANILFLDIEIVDGLLVAGGADGNLYQLETGANDNGSSIAWSWTSKDFPLGPSLAQTPVWKVGADMNSNFQAVAFTGNYDSHLHSVALGTASNGARQWSTDQKGETTQIPRRNVSLTLSGTATKEVQIFGLKIDSEFFQ